MYNNICFLGDIRKYQEFYVGKKKKKKVPYLELWKGKRPDDMFTHCRLNELPTLYHGKILISI